MKSNRSAILWAIVATILAAVVSVCLQKAHAQTLGTYQVGCHPVVAGTMKLEYLDYTNDQPLYSITVDASQGIYTGKAFTGGTVTVYLRVTCTSADGTIPTAQAVFKIHYPDAPVPITPNAPTGITVTL